MVEGDFVGGLALGAAIKASRRRGRLSIGHVAPSAPYFAEKGAPAARIGVANSAAS